MPFNPLSWLAALSPLKKFEVEKLSNSKGVPFALNKKFSDS
jgi:hypothetical protein